MASGPNVEPESVEANANDDVVALVRAGGPLVIDVSGAAATVNERLAVRAFPAGSVARTENVYDPFASGPSVRGDVHGVNMGF